jgi:hypothetical protein
MRHRSTTYGICYLTPITASLILTATVFPGDKGYKEIGRTTEKELNVVLSSGFGSVYISHGEPEKILVAEGIPENDGDPLINIQYSLRNRVGYMEINLGQEGEDHERKRGAFHVGHFGGGKWFLRFGDAIPISFDIELGLGEGRFDFSGLQVKDLSLTSGASDVSVSFDKPNKAIIDNINIESGVSKFTGRNLGNANFKRLRFQGGVGAYTLDFSGQLAREVDVDVEVGLGALTIIIPENVGAKVFYEESWVSKLDCNEDFRPEGEDQYITENYYSSTGKMNITIDAGLGRVKLTRR